MSDLLSAAGLKKARVARDRFLGGDDATTGVRPTIQRSWARSADKGVKPDLRRLPEVNISTSRSRLFQAAEPVLNDLSAHLSDTSTALLLADRDGVVLGRWVPDKSLLRLMDRSNSAPGFTLSEEVIGTNGLGSVLEERSPFAVIGPEHYADIFQEYSCFGAPIINPRTNRIEGVLTFVCRLRDSSPLMLPFVASTTAQITEQLPGMGSRSDRHLIAEFRAASKNSRDPMLLLGENLVIANPRGADYLSQVGPERLWSAADGALRGQNQAESEKQLGEDRLMVRPLGRAQTSLGAIIRVVSDELMNTPDAPTDPLSALRNRIYAFDPVWDPMLSLAIASYRSKLPLAFFGEQGSGKATFARAIHEVCTPFLPFTTLHAGLADVEGTQAWIRRLSLALEHPGTIVLEHVNALDAQDSALVATVIETGDMTGDHHIICTVSGHPETTELTPDVSGALAVQTVCLPSLRERVGDIPPLLRAFGRHEHGGTLKFSAEAMQVLCAYDWPGNLKQLRRFTQKLSVEFPDRVIGEELLPVDMTVGIGKSLSEIERLERRAIQVALARCGQNKSRAAEQLGISRATLYRKIRTYRL